MPLPLVELAAAAVMAEVLPVLAPSARLAQHLVTVALVVVLFEGGASLGAGRIRPHVLPIAVVGLGGTVLTAAAVAVTAKLAIGAPWYLSLLVGAAVSPTDPAVVFAVLGRQGARGPAPTLLAGESGANDPVGIALMASLVAAGGLSGGAVAHAVGDFALQLSVGIAGALVGTALLRLALTRLPALPADVTILVTLASALALYELTDLARGSGFLAVFGAGILLGDTRAGALAGEERTSTIAAGTAELAAFAVLGLTIDLGRLADRDVWLPALVIMVVTTVAIRPGAVALCLWRSGLGRNERVFVAFSGLKGAVPLLLGTTLLTAGVADAGRLYAIVVVVVALSVLVQGSLVPPVARRLRLTAD